MRSIYRMCHWIMAISANLKAAKCIRGPVLLGAHQRERDDPIWRKLADYEELYGVTRDAASKMRRINFGDPVVGQLYGARNVPRARNFAFIKQGLIIDDRLDRCRLP